MYSIIENKDFIKLEVAEGISYSDLCIGIEKVLDITNKNDYRGRLEEKFLVKFKEKAKVFNRNKNKIVKSVRVDFFKHYRGLCYKINKRTGYLLSYMDWDKISSIEILSLDSETKKEEIAKNRDKFFKRVKNQLFDDKTWSNLDEDSFNSSYKYFYYLNKLDLLYSDRLKLEEAFKDKKNITINQYGEKRHYSIETKMGEDGVFRAWFSSEFADCANGSYYLLLNPNVAVHYEND